MLSAKHMEVFTHILLGILRDLRETKKKNLKYTISCRIRIANHEQPSWTLYRKWKVHKLFNEVSVEDFREEPGTALQRIQEDTYKCIFAVSRSGSEWDYL